MKFVYMAHLQPGLHVLKPWMVDPGLVVDAIIGDGGGVAGLGYTWPLETWNPNK